MARDVQRAKVYGAEQFLRHTIEQHRKHGLSLIEIAGSQITVPDELLFGSLDGVRVYLRNIEQQEWFKALWPNHRPVNVKQRQGNAKATYRGREHAVLLHDAEQRGKAWAMRELVVLHEMAHAVTWGADEVHGPEFVAAFILLVQRQMGDEAGWLLSYVMQTSDVRVDHSLFVN